MKIRWMGHASFLLENSAGNTLLTDPFDASVGYPTPALSAHVLTVSHEHHDHNCLDHVTGPAAVFRNSGSAAGFTLTAVDSFHDDTRGSQRGANRIFLIESEGLRIAHLGDLGHPLSPAQCEALGRVDILMIPIGGFYTIDAQTAWQITCDLKPRCVFPMHYLTPWLSFPISDEAPYLALAGEPLRGMKEVILTADTLPKTFTVYLPDLYTA